MSSFEVPEPLDTSDVGDRFARVVAIIIVTTTLVAGAVGYLESRAGARAEDASARAEKFGIEALTSTSRSQSAALAEYDAYIQSELNAAHEAIFFRRWWLAEGDSDEERLADVEQEVWRLVAEDARDASAIDLAGEQGPDADPVFPGRYLAEASRDSLVMTALQDAANEEASAWGDMAASLIAVLTMFAVALYLLGSSLALHRGIGRILAVAGTVLAVVATGWTVVVARDQPGPPSEEAAEAFGDGMVTLHAAHDQGTFARAEQLLSDAIEQRPTFARAYVERSTATFQADSPQVPGVPSSISSVDATRRSAEDLRTALDLGYDSAQLYNNLGFNLVLLAVQDDRPDLLDEAIGHLEGAIRRDPDNPIQRYNLGLGLLAAGRFDAAATAYEQAVLSTLYLDAAEAERDGRRPSELRANPNSQVAMGALTDLQILVDLAGDEVADRARTAKEYVVGSVDRATGQLGVGQLDASIRDVELAVFPAEVQYTAVIEAAGEPDPLWVQWYHRPSPRFGWAALPGVSGTAEQFSAFEVADGDRTGVLVPFLPYSRPPSCLPAGDYRAEFYADGNLVATQDTTATHPPLEAVVARALNVGWCRPHDWQVSDTRVNGLAEGHVAPGSDRGMFVIRLPVSPGDDLQNLVSGVLDGLDTWRFFLPESVGRLDAGTHVQDYFLGFDAASVRRYEYDGGVLMAGAGAGAKDPGSIIIGLVFGPPHLFDGEGPALGRALLDSMLLLE